MGYLKESIVADFLKTMLVGAGLTIIMLLVIVLGVWGLGAAVINYPKTVALIVFLIFSIGVGYDYWRSNS